MANALYNHFTKIQLSVTSAAIVDENIQADINERLSGLITGDLSKHS